MTDSPAAPGAAILPFDERTRRVLQLRDQIRRGAYRPDPQAVARALLEHWRTFADIHEAAIPAGAFDRGRFIVPPTTSEAETTARVAS